MSSTAPLNYYKYLPAFYERVGLADYSAEMMARILLLAQQSGWAGRRVMDMACGTGTAAIWLAREGFRVSGVDISSEMLIRARGNAQAAHCSTVTWRQGDIREPDTSAGALDLVTWLRGLNHIQSLRDLERVFANTAAALAPGKLFVFDLDSVQGLVTRWGTGVHLLYNDGSDLTITVQSTFSYETLVATLRYIIFYDVGEGWQRAEEVHLLRGYPLQAVNALLERAGFDVLDTLDASLEPCDTGQDSGERVLFVARKRAN